MTRVGPISASVVLMCICAWSFGITVGVYSAGPGAKGVAEGLAGQDGLHVIELAELDTTALADCDVVLLSSVKGLGGGNESWRAEMRAFVAAGGGVVLEHDAVGCQGWTDDTILFPEIAAIGVDRSSTKKVCVVAEHPVTAGLAAEFEHAYQDHIYMQVGPAGETVINDADGLATVIVGAYGMGRVVANGMISGYSADANGAAGDRPPSGEPLKLLLNAIRWAGAVGLSQMPPGEIVARMSEAVKTETAGKGAEPVPYTGWYTRTAVQEMAFQKQPMGELGGRAWMWWDVRAGYSDEMIHRSLRNMKRSGVTDVIYLGQGGLQVGWLSEIPDAKPKFWMGRYKGRDPLAAVVKAAKAEGMRVWLGMHSGDYGEGKIALDQNGKPYMYGKQPIDDTQSPDLRRFLKDVLTEAKQKYDLAGLYYDELFFDYVDMHGDDFDQFSFWCDEHFGEIPEASLLEKLTAGSVWTDPNDVWWRRMALYKAWCNADFYKYLADTAHDLGMQAIGELRPCARYEVGWKFAMDTVALVDAGCDIYYVAPDCEAAMVYPNACCGQHQGRGMDFYHTTNMRGKPTFNFVYNSMELPFAYGVPDRPDQMRKLLRDCREWEGAQSLASTCILTYQMGLMLQNADPRAQDNRERNLMRRLGRYVDVERMEAQETEYFGNYKVLVAPEQSLQGHGPEVFDGIRKYVNDGGTVISLGGQWIQSRRDFTQSQDMTEEFVGGRYEGDARAVDGFKLSQEYWLKLAPQDVIPFVPAEGTEVLATFADGHAAVTRKHIGGGQVIGIHFDAAKEMELGGVEPEEYLARLIWDAADPGIRILDAGAEMKVTLRKGNWVAATLYEPENPATVKVAVDIEKLGINAEGYRVLLYGRDRELLTPTGMWDITHWTAEQLRDGIELTIPHLGIDDWALPEQVEMSQMPEREQKWLETVVPNMWSENAKLRQWGYEVLVVAPSDELTIDGETVVGAIE